MVKEPNVTVRPKADGVERERDLGFDIPGIQEHVIESRCVAQRFRIRVFQPIMRQDKTERFPVVYATDADKLFGALSALSSEMQLFGDIPRFVLVGIGYENSVAADLLRMRDLFTHAARGHIRAVIDQIAASPLGRGVSDLTQITATTDSSDFLRFIRTELVPFVSARYPIVSDNSTYYGFSAGGTFGLYTLLSQPDTFRHYILGSPGTSYNGIHFGNEMAQSLLKERREIHARVFMSVGELEEFYAQFDLTTGYYLLAKYLRRVEIPGLDLTLRVFPGESHATAWPLAFAHGIRTMFGTPSRTPYRPDFEVRT